MQSDVRVRRNPDVATICFILLWEAKFSFVGYSFVKHHSQAYLALVFASYNWVRPTYQSSLCVCLCACMPVCGDGFQQITFCCFSANRLSRAAHSHIQTELWLTQLPGEKHWLFFSWASVAFLNYFTKKCLSVWVFQSAAVSPPPSLCFLAQFRSFLCIVASFAVPAQPGKHAA